MAAILLVDGDTGGLLANKAILEKEGFLVYALSSAAAAIDTLLNQSVDLAVIDVELPDISGFELCRKIKKYCQIPILFLTAKSTDDDKVLGLTLGDDYITKPYSLRELVARVHLHLRRRHEAQINLPPITIDLVNRRVLANGTLIKLPNIEFDILALLASMPGHVFSYEDIYNKVWHQLYANDNHAIIVRVSTIKEKLYQACGCRFISSRRGYGYCLNIPE